MHSHNVGEGQGSKQIAHSLGGFGGMLPQKILKFKAFMVHGAICMAAEYSKCPLILRKCAIAIISDIE